jgi:AraC-like DNA-binding protein
MADLYPLHLPPCYPGGRGVHMATAAQAQTTPTATDPVLRWFARRNAAAPPSKNLSSPAPIPNPQSPTPPSPRAATNRANSAHSTGPRTESGKQRSSLNALSHGLTARTAVLPTEDPETYRRHIQQFLDEYAPATPTETQLVHEIADTAWRLRRIPFLEAELFSQSPDPQTLIATLAKLGLHGSRLSRQFQKAIEQLRDIQDERRHLERRQLTEAADLLIRHQHKGLPWQPEDDGFVFSKQQIERHARHLMLQNPAYYGARGGPVGCNTPRRESPSRSAT